MKEQLIRQLNAQTISERTDAIRQLAGLYNSGRLPIPQRSINVNNHIHTTFSFSPYSPTMAVYRAWESGLATAGIMDHDNTGGAYEFIQAGQIIGLPVTVGFECRCSMKDTPFEGRRVNNPDQISTAYMAMHAIAHHMLGEVETFLQPLREKRNIRNRAMTERLNDIIRPYGLEIDFERDVLPLSQHANGGCVTERHLLYALCAALTDREMPRHFLLGLFKSHLIERVYIDADEELMHITQFTALAQKLGAIPAYAYLGDVGQSVTGDKKAQAFEDAYLDELMGYLKDIGIKAVTYMPARNSDEQLSRIIETCRTYDFFEISGEDINSPLQSFICEKIETPQCRHLIDSAWALIGHERACADDISNGIFSDSVIEKIPGLYERIIHFARLAKQSSLQ